MDFLYKRSFYGALLGHETRGTIKGNGVSTFSTIFRIRRGNGHQGAILGEKYQDKYSYFIPVSINNPESQPYRQQWIAAVHKWRYDLTDEQKAEYNQTATKNLHMSGYNLFMRRAMKGEIDMFVDRGDPATYDWAKEDLILDGAWHDLDLTSIIPAGAKAAFIVGHVKGAGAEWGIIFRKKGNTNETNHGGMQTLRANITRHRSSIVAMDSNRVIQYKADNEAWTDLDLAVRAWWT